MSTSIQLFREIAGKLFKKFLTNVPPSVILKMEAVDETILGIARD